MSRRRGSKPTFEYGKWRIRWVDYAGRRRSEVFYNKHDAWNELRRRELEAEDIRHGRRAPVRAPDRTLGDLFDYWTDKRVLHKRTEYDDNNIIKNHLRPAFGHVRLRDFSTAHVDAFVDARSYLNHKTVRNLLTLLITTLNVAKNDLHWIPEVPRIKKPKRRDAKESYRYLQTDHEIARLLRAAFDDYPASTTASASAPSSDGARRDRKAALSNDRFQAGPFESTTARPIAGDRGALTTGSTLRMQR